MLSLLIIIIFAYNFYVSARRGLPLQLFYTVGYLLTVLVARLLYKPFGESLDLLIPYPSASLDSHFVFFTTTVGLGLDHAFYAGCAFLIILVVGWGITHLLALFLHSLVFNRLDPVVNLGGSLFLSFFVTYVALFFMLYLLALIPIDGIQNMLDKSWLATLIVRYSPFLTNWVTQLWIVQ
ncbi:CvpA family protein [Lapidilactobacillus mulanensis]|uniref:CvpA family protein n=1 Tax=Lapidilactobacillus mulanensis TaxID=2485999 RepID=A0ABW4DKH7_9LACO|nr:CvpA family protein [Lapidilactobacillus mulanensis]